MIRRNAVIVDMNRHTVHRGAVDFSSTGRCGAISAMVLVVLIMLSGLVAAQVKKVLFERHQSRNEMQYLQAERLADAGLLIAQQQLASNPDWDGIVWKIPAGSIHQTNSGVVTITVDEQKRFHVVAQYPSNFEPPYQVTRTRKY